MVSLDFTRYIFAALRLHHGRRADSVHSSQNYVDILLWITPPVEQQHVKYARM